MEAGLFTLCGVIVGAILTFILTRSAQHEQWRRDNLKQEYRELLSVLTSSYGRVIRLEAPGRPRDSDDQRELDDAHLAALAVIRDRLFIARSPTLMTVLKTWQAATTRFADDGDFLAFRESFNNLHAAIIGAADRDLGLGKRGFSKPRDKIVK